ncbi:hypothetical protein AYI70_g7923 [Smittium culicis]|uniref:Uncharacterized protein n=1 Tax=Smittium culicis TaxID=133412 RepID=A0A1R1XIB4_9FUNG|nr:hypothetical protein AYI70_g7923 [Smittium culicis]
MLTSTSKSACKLTQKNLTEYLKTSSLVYPFLKSNQLDHFKSSIPTDFTTGRSANKDADSDVQNKPSEHVEVNKHASGLEYPKNNKNHTTQQENLSSIKHNDLKINSIHESIKDSNSVDTSSTNQKISLKDNQNIKPNESYIDNEKNAQELQTVSRNRK